MDTTVTDARLRAQQATLIATVKRELRTVTSVVLGERFRSIDEKVSEDGREYFSLEDAQGGSADLWLDAIPMVSGMIANTMTNTTTDQYVVQISDRLPSEFLTRVLAHEVGELIAARDRSSQGLAPVRENLLNQEADIGDRNELSSRDHGRIAELNWLAARASDAELSEPQRAGARADLSALIDHCGLRPVSALTETEAHTTERKSARSRLFASWNSLSSKARPLIAALARPIEHLDPADAAALQASRDAALRAERQVEAFIGRREVTMPMPGYDQNGLPLPRDQLEAASVQWAEYRAQVSTRTEQAKQSALRARAVAAVQAGDESAVQRRSTIPERWRRPDLGQEAEAGTETGTEPPGGNAAAHAAPPQEKDQPRQHSPEAEWAPKPPAPAPAKPAPERAAPGKPLWETGMPERGTPRTSRPTTQQPQQLPPGHERPEPGVGMGD